MQETALRLLEDSQLSLILIGPDERIVWHNRSAAALFRLEYGELNGRPAPFTVPNQQGSTPRVVGRGKAGHEFEIDLILTPMEFEDAGSCVLCIIQEPQPPAATAGQAWYQRENPFRALVDNAPEGVAFSRNLRAIYANRKFIEMYGLEGEIYGQPIVGMVAPEEVPAFLVRASQRERGFEQDVVYETVAQRKDGKRFRVSASVTRIDLEDGPATVGFFRDVTSQQEALDALAESEGLLRHAFDSSISGMALVANDGSWIKVNPALCGMLGYGAEEMFQCKIQMLTHKDDLEKKLDLRRQIAAGARNSYQIEQRYIHKDGRVVWVNASVAGVRNSSGELLYFVYQVQDITERKRVEEALRASEGKFRAVVENSDELITFADGKGTVLYRSPSSQRITGYSGDEALGASGFERIHPDDVAAVRETWKDLISHPDSVRKVHNRIQRKDGSWAWIEHSAQNLLENPTVGAVIITSRDVTQSKRAEEALRESERRLSMAISATADAIWEWNVETGQTYYSPRWYEMMGYANGQLPMSVDTWISLCHDGDFVAATDPIRSRRVGSKNKAFETDIQMRHKDGHWRWIKVRGSVMEYDASGQASVISGTNTEITAQKRLEEQLTQAHKMEAIGRLAGGVAHDFNNLLTVINGYSELTLRQLKPDDPLRPRLEEIHKAGERAAGLTSQLLAFSRKQILQPRALNLNTVVMAMESMLRRLVSEDVQISLTLCEGRPMLHADQHQLEQVIMNLAVNARDAMPSGGKLSIETTISDQEMRPGGWFGNANEPGGRYAVLAVTDSGAGMDEATRERIFEPFFTTKGAGQGTGLGLSMVQGIVAQSGGFIEVESEKGKGTTFRVWLPGSAEVASAIPGAAAALAQHGSETVLVVEDQAYVREYVVNVLTAYGYNVIEAANGEAALSICKHAGAAIHLLLTDVVMPNMSGAELSLRIKELGKGIKTLCMSGYTDRALGQNGNLDETINFIQKPFTPEELAAKIREILG